MKINNLKIFSILFIFLVSTPVLAKKMHGLAMHGQPKYDENFTYLEYVNPEAPKNGTIKFGSYGSFDNLNRVAFKGSRAAGLGYLNNTLMRRVWDEAFT
jgi:ABC-type oligopeptide transport system, periplasmic component